MSANNNLKNKIYWKTIFVSCYDSHFKDEKLAETCLIHPHNNELNNNIVEIPLVHFSNTSVYQTTQKMTENINRQFSRYVFINFAMEFTLQIGLYKIGKKTESLFI